ncbi:MAG: pyridoxamine 5'-phosphate oxidase family protein [Clostridiaceae bacterium]
MFREMRRIRQKLDQTEVNEILLNSSTGILGVIGENGYPYTVPVNYTYTNGAVYIHCAITGHKVDALKACDKVSFTVVSEDEVVPSTFSTNYKSVIGFGKASIVEENTEKRLALDSLVDKYSSSFKEEGNREIEREWSLVSIIKIEFDHISGKTAKSLVKSGK